MTFLFLTSKTPTIVSASKALFYVPLFKEYNIYSFKYFDLKKILLYIPINETYVKPEYKIVVVFFTKFSKHGLQHDAPHRLNPLLYLNESDS